MRLTTDLPQPLVRRLHLQATITGIPIKRLLAIALEKTLLPQDELSRRVTESEAMA